MPEKKTIERAKRAKAEGRPPTTQAGEFVREEMHHIREGKHGARSREQAIAIGLSKARRAGVKLPARGVKGKTKESAERALKKGAEKKGIHGYAVSPRRSRAVEGALEREARPKLRGARARRAARKAARTRNRRGTQWRGGRHGKYSRKKK